MSIELARSVARIAQSYMSSGKTPPGEDPATVIRQIAKGFAVEPAMPKAEPKPKRVYKLRAPRVIAAIIPTQGVLVPEPGITSVIQPIALEFIKMPETEPTTQSDASQNYRDNEEMKALAVGGFRPIV